MARLSRSLLFLIFGGLALAFVAPAAGVAQSPDSTQSSGGVLAPTSSDTLDKDVPFVATAQQTAEGMLKVADVSEDDVVYDLGSGDGRIVITAAKQFGARGVGVEIDPELVAEARANAREAGVSDRVEFRQGDLFNADVHDATVVALYLWPEVNIKLRPKLLRQLDPGDRIVSHDFRMGDWKPDRTVQLGQGKTGTETAYLWIVPETIPDDLMEIPDELESN